VREPQWIDRINNMRNRIKKNKKDFDKRKNKKANNDENDGIGKN
jgi:ribosomal protein S15P/S13E